MRKVAREQEDEEDPDKAFKDETEERSKGRKKGKGKGKGRGRGRSRGRGRGNSIAHETYEAEDPVPKETELEAEETMLAEPESTSTVSKLPAHAFAELKPTRSKARSVLKRAKSKSLGREEADKLKRCKSRVALSIKAPPPGNPEEPVHKKKRNAPAEENTPTVPVRRTAAKSKSQKPEEESTLKPKSGKDKKEEAKPNKPKGKPAQDAPSGSSAFKEEKNPKDKEKQDKKKEAQETNEVFQFEKADSEVASPSFVSCIWFHNLTNHHLIFAGIQLQDPPESDFHLQCPERSSSAGLRFEAGTSAETES